MNSWTLVLILSLATVFLVEGRSHRGRGHEDYYYDDDYELYDDYPQKSKGGSSGVKSFIRKFQKVYCRNVAGEYRKCQLCVYVGCLSYMKNPNQIAEYDACIEDNNRCCTQPGVSFQNAFLAGKCYASGFITEVGGGQLSVARTITGGQAADAPKAFQGKHKHDK